ncbi:hypothetical protein CHS0354_011421 [Potamilus streckersoni]|uniref:Uncharacterized protein n=1 Tax=Potamilus streckersoni TaxID=2493646 RepID=A0AAE0TG52_9BIVA|nr:hypothetical protein CHS0354_011421 [Potamilus streckersoni]
MNSIVFMIIAILPLRAKAFVLKETKWENLRVTWGIDPFNPNNFACMPKTEQEAMSDGWVKKSYCSAERHFVGMRYWKNQDPSVMLLYDIKGYIAGIQTGITKDVKTWSGEDYPFQQQSNAPFVDDGDLYIITAYFTDPGTISIVGRTESDFITHGIGNHLYIQNGILPTDVITAPTNESEVSSTGWTKGKCFRYMGVYYWYNLRVDMPCSDLFPAFLLYNEGKLSAFGWALQTNVAGTQRLEHLPTSTFSLLMKTVPSCLDYPGTVTSLHIYMNTRHSFNKC